MRIKLEIFEGPLDLLFYLVKKDHINIYDIPIARITQQYLEYLDLMRLLDLNIAGEFLVMAATLTQIKSRMLLPQAKKEEIKDEMDPRQELVEKLLEYEKFKEVAQHLGEREKARDLQFTRRAHQIPHKEEGKEPYFEASVFDLICAFTEALREVPKDLFYEVVRDEFSVEAKIHEILHFLLKQDLIVLNQLFQSAKNKLEIISIFLAVLELIRLKEIVIYQNRLFEEIKISRNTNNILPYEKDERQTDSTQVSH
ncbi:MAG: segregation/condensation protein A [Candidatus Omnitrophica bacterium]|nr:segregation/condensation protein A [Candidatus Omnitrophota bacterium]